MIKIGFCVSYDWMMLKKSLPRIYSYADKICLSLDKNRRSWSGQSYVFNEREFSTFLSEIDVDRKIDLYEDDFAIEGLTAMQNDSRQRMLMAKRLGDGGWHIQIDSDEYFLNFPDFIKRLKRINTNPTGKEKPLNVCACWISLIKRVESGFLYVDFKQKEPEVAPFATTKPLYERARHNGYFNAIAPCYVIHETWARSDDELWFKLNNWGHSGDEMKEKKFKLSYYNLWKSLDEYNYKYISDFHPALAHVWPSLGLIKAASIEELLENFKEPRFPLTSFQLMLRNNRNIARLKSLGDKFFF